MQNVWIANEITVSKGRNNLYLFAEKHWNEIFENNTHTLYVCLSLSLDVLFSFRSIEWWRFREHERFAIKNGVYVVEMCLDCDFVIFDTRIWLTDTHTSPRTHGRKKTTQFQWIFRNKVNLVPNDAVEWESGSKMRNWWHNDQWLNQFSALL